MQGKKPPATEGQGKRIPQKTGGGLLPAFAPAALTESGKDTTSRDCNKQSSDDEDNPEIYGVTTDGTPIDNYGFCYVT